jgi:hypothetical protein
MAGKKRVRVKHLNEIQARVHFRANGLRVSVTVPWDDLERRLGVSLEASRKKSRKKRKSPAAPAA